MPLDLLVLGTTNRHKVVELVELLAGLELPIRSLADYPAVPPVDETGETFAANAALKAVGHARHLRTWVLGEDSGIEVDALQGRPGVYSARYAGPAASDDENNARLLDDLGTTAIERRTARYVCRLALADPTGALRAECDGQCRGRIRFEPAGTNGFGYDPLFELVEYHHTFGELGPSVKRVLSHRARAIERLLPRVAELMTCG
jgi:XTP/dITP diphosphohydrolase